MKSIPLFFALLISLAGTAMPGAGTGLYGAETAAVSTTYIEPDDGLRWLTRLVDHAQHTVFVETYILSDRSIVRAIERASARGVLVYVLLEPHPLGLGSQPRQMYDLLTAAGARVRWTSRRYFLTHAKYMVMDNRIAVVSTANFSRSGFTLDRDVALIDRDERDVRALSRIFRADWDGTSPGKQPPDLVLSPVNARADLSALMVGARRSLDVYAEELADSGIERLLVKVARRARVRILLPAGGTVTNRSWLTRHGVAIRTPRRPYIHAKVIMVDGTMGFVGSENLSATSLDRNREVGLLVGRAVVARCERVFARDWTSSP